MLETWEMRRKMRLARKKLFKGRMKPGYWDLHPFGCEEEFDVHGYIHDVESGEIEIDRNQTWYRVLKYDVEHGVYNKTIWRRAYHHFYMFCQNIDYYVHRVSHGVLFPFSDYPSVTCGGNVFIWLALIYGDACYPRQLRITWGGSSQACSEIDKVYGDVSWK